MMSKHCRLHCLKTNWEFKAHGHSNETINLSKNSNTNDIQCMISIKLLNFKFNTEIYHISHGHFFFKLTLNFIHCFLTKSPFTTCVSEICFKSQLQVLTNLGITAVY